MHNGLPTNADGFLTKVQATTLEVAVGMGKGGAGTSGLLTSSLVLIAISAGLLADCSMIWSIVVLSARKQDNARF